MTPENDQSMVKSEWEKKQKHLEQFLHQLDPEVKKKKQLPKLQSKAMNKKSSIIFSKT